MKILDCTLRDGGYYTGWCYDRDMVDAYLRTMSACEIDLVEIGFRFASEKADYGPFAFCPEWFLQSLTKPAGQKWGVMVNASDLLPDVIETTTRLFPDNCSESRVDFVRVASHRHEWPQIRPAISLLKRNGYTVMLNLMQASLAEVEEIKRFASEMEDLKVSGIYFADSLGNLTPERSRSIANVMASSFSSVIGFHGHDNIGLGLSNSLAALEGGASHIDATVTGMGRGAGNTKLEELLLELSDRVSEEGLSRLLELISEFFGPLQQRCGWGKNVYYFLAAKKGIHPSYVQELLTNARYSSADVTQALTMLSKQDSSRYSRAYLSGQFEDREDVVPEAATFDPGKLGKRVLLVGPGHSVTQNKLAIEKFIESGSTTVVALNATDNLSDAKIDFRVGCHPIRLRVDAREMEKSGATLILPFAQAKAIFDDSVLRNARNYSLHVVDGEFCGEPAGCTIPAPQSLWYALALIAACRPDELYLAGFDGFVSDQKRTAETEAVFKQFINSMPTVAVMSITPTLYKLDRFNLYSIQ